jgi:predicted adenylyl cyclase CyaB
MPKEIEAKIRITEKEAKELLSRLKGMGLRWCMRREYNTYFQTSCDWDGALRLREEEIERFDHRFYHKDRQNRITFKGPVLKGKYKSREELETNLFQHQVEPLKQIIEGMGFFPSIRFEKIRHEFQWKGAHATVCVDELPEIGFFVEAEAPSEKAVKQILESLGLQERKTLKSGYPTLLRIANPKKKEYCFSKRRKS